MTAQALASANVDCRIDDRFIAFELEAIAGRGGPIVQVNVGSILIKAAAGAELTAAQKSFDRSHIVQQWSLGDEMKLQIDIVDEKTKENVNLVIAARLNGKTDKYNGSYVLNISRGGKTKELKGRIKECVAG